MRNLNNIAEIRHGGKFLVEIRRGGKLIWQAVRNCLAGGWWQHGHGWEYGHGWREKGIRNN